MVRGALALWALLASLEGGAAAQRRLKHRDAPISADDDGSRPTEGAQWACLIDAGSTGSRLHLYEWAPRVYHSLPLRQDVSMPLASEKWTQRMKPGLSSYMDDPRQAAESLVPLIDFAKASLAEFQERWHTFPIYLKATAGMRELDLDHREAIMREVRAFLRRNDTCPFRFTDDEQARVIAGEEEAAFGWTAVNFVSGTLFGDGDVRSWSGTASPSRTVGTVEMGGASAQISFFRPEQDILANLFKLQVGPVKHWNIYAHSFLQFGRVSARKRMWSALAETAGRSADVAGGGSGGSCFDDPLVVTGARECVLVDACMPRGSRTVPPPHVTGEVGIHPPTTYAPLLPNVTVVAHPDPSWERCIDQISSPLGFSGDRYNRWCTYTHHAQCSYAGVYQPELPLFDSPHGKFMLIGGFVNMWASLGLNDTGSTLNELASAASAVCGLDIAGVEESIRAAARADQVDRLLPLAPELCFQAALSYSMLRDGHHFELDRTFLAVEKMRYRGVNLKVGWQLGAILYEINALPWKFMPEHDGDSTQEAAEEPTAEPPSLLLPLLATAVCSACCTAAVLGRCSERGKPRGSLPTVRVELAPRLGRAVTPAATSHEATALLRPRPAAGQTSHH